MSLVALAFPPLALVIILVIFLIGVALVWYGSVAPDRAAIESKGPALAPQSGAPKSKNGTLTWTLRIDDSARDLPPATRIELIDGMGTVGAPWCADILQQAFGEEREPEVRDAILGALVECAQRSSGPTFEQALGSERATERAYAADGLAAIGAFSSVARALDDREDGVALAAAYALQRAGQATLVDQYLASNAGSPRAATIREMIETLR